MEQVEENVNSADLSGPHTLTEREVQLISRVREKYLEYGFIGCTGCRYCMPCPEAVDISGIFELFNEYYTKRRGIDGRGDSEVQQKIKERYLELITPEKGAKRCAKCRECEEKCPQQLPIHQLIARAARVFERDR
jgi:predicted aldo/keto reductase-like oxidoreductase